MTIFILLSYLCSGLNVSIFYDEICSYISDNFKFDGKIFLLGDFNIGKASTSDNVRGLMELFVRRAFKKSTNNWAL